MRRRLLCAFVLIATSSAFTRAVTAQHTLYGSVQLAPDAIVDTHAALNDEHAMRQHYVVLVSLDGFRYDYLKEHGAPHLQAMMKRGAGAPDGMLPSYPSLTFPNHWTLVTGLRPEHHGIVRNRFYDPVRKDDYQYTDDAKNTDGSWYGGTPLWSLAEQQGMRAAAFMWPGSQSEVAGKRPAFYAKFQDYVDGHAGIDQVIAWLKLPSAERPHLLTMYMSNTDHAGHWYGPDSVEEKQAVHVVDALMGELRARLTATGLPVDLVIVADHGMILNDNNWVQFDQFADLSKVKYQDGGFYAESEADAAKLYADFKAHPDPRFNVYRRKDVPPELNFSSSARIGDPVIVMKAPYIGHAHATETARTDVGDHGYDPLRTPEMKAVFVANGPDIKPGVTLPVFPNVDVYSFIAKLLDLTPGANDGEIGPLREAIETGSRE